MHESFSAGKRGVDDPLCEDGIVSSPHHVAVIDGATTEPGNEIEGRAPGRFVMEVLAGALADLDPRVDAKGAIHELSAVVAAALSRRGARVGALASACVLIASAQRREIWRVGNSTFTVGGKWFSQPWALVDVPARMRATYLKALLREGSTSVEEAGRDDPARELIAPLLRVEHVFRNAVDAGELAYAAIDGADVPDRLIECVPIPAGVEVIFASDGYPLIKPTLAETEDYLKRSLAEDPLRIGRHPEVRGVGEGWESYDDRAYLRFSLI